MSQIVQILFFFLISISSVYALTFPIPEDSDVIGEVKTASSKKGQTLVQFGLEHDIGAREIVNANPGLSPYKKLPAGTQVTIPSQYILPPGERKGIVINLAEYRLYYYLANGKEVVTMPVGIGKENSWQTPTGNTKVVRKDKEPTWRPTDNVRAEAAKNGMPIPNAFPSGPLNPLGSYVLRLGWPTYLIHGTNRPDGVGKRVSAGCLRLLPTDAKYLYESISVGTPVRVINEPFKVGWSNNQYFFEAHPYLEENKAQYKDGLLDIVSLINGHKQNGSTYIQWSKVYEAAKQKQGLPREIKFSLPSIKSQESNHPS